MWSFLQDATALPMEFEPKVYGLYNSCDDADKCMCIYTEKYTLGFPAASLDFSTVSNMDDINSSDGFVRSVLYIMHLKPRGLLWAAPPCSSWVWVEPKTKLQIR